MDHIEWNEFTIHQPNTKSNYQNHPVNTLPSSQDNNMYPIFSILWFVSNI